MKKEMVIRFWALLMCVLCMFGFVSCSASEKERVDMLVLVTDSENECDIDTQSVVEQTEPPTTQPELESDIVEVYDDVKLRIDGSINYRNKPTTASSVFQIIPSGTIVDVLGKTRNGWYKIEYNEHVGYVTSEYSTLLTKEESDMYSIEKIYAGENPVYAIVTSDVTMNVRSGPSTDFEVLTYTKPLSVIKVYEKLKCDWYKVETNTIVGYAYGENMKILTAEEYKELGSSKELFMNPGENIIATYTTTSTYNENSRTNMQLAAGYIDGTIVKAGESYSHLIAIHPNDGDEPYVEAMEYNSKGELVKGVGGGVCQTSSTANAAIVYAKEQGYKTGLVVSFAEPHSGRVNYVEERYEATISDGYLDFCFRNCNSFDVLIEAKTEGNTLTITYKACE